MGEENEKSNNLDYALKPFYDRAYDAEVRLSKLESLLSKDGYANTDNKKESSMIKDLESKLYSVQDELVSEKEKASTEIKKLEAENKKLQYRVTHLIQALKEADLKFKNIKT
ncbi:uncharacterized protein A4U43_C05F980 [Asparagus officinalis]|uniref:Uncharacterized protein n=1 Tax=Asparagus officinalis TaxID=4686 RepID=A0A5P1ENE4_ASPOF|nr:uncharacterized protein LOC109843418 [Asparagus officinalis]XP_020267946.1 uncharacterized protein LOC109843418 [Asparagus officinalis]ONK67528.1 uncharacterized protein A4U43_C05F980 [Asparagus officinalis]